MEKPECPHCGKHVVHRKKCIVLRKQEAEQQKLERERQIQQRAEQARIEAERKAAREQAYQEEKERFAEQFPTLFEHMDARHSELVKQIQDLEDRMDDIRECDCNRWGRGSMDIGCNCGCY